MRFQDKAFEVTECGNNGFEDEDVLEDHLFLAGLGKGKSSGGKKAKQTCPIKCGVGHTNCSLFFLVRKESGFFIMKIAQAPCVFFNFFFC